MMFREVYWFEQEPKTLEWAPGLRYCYYFTLEYLRHNTEEYDCRYASSLYARHFSSFT